MTMAVGVGWVTIVGVGVIFGFLEKSLEKKPFLSSFGVGDGEGVASLAVGVGVFFPVNISLRRLILPDRTITKTMTTTSPRTKERTLLKFSIRAPL